MVFRLRNQQQSIKWNVCVYLWNSQITKPAPRRTIFDEEWIVGLRNGSDGGNDFPSAVSLDLGEFPLDYESSNVSLELPDCSLKLPDLNSSSQRENGPLSEPFGYPNSSNEN